MPSLNGSIDVNLADIINAVTAMHRETGPFFTAFFLILTLVVLPLIALNGLKQILRGREISGKEDELYRNRKTGGHRK